jgi:hypothetical protein
VSMQHAMKVYAGVVVQFHELSGKWNDWPASRKVQTDLVHKNTRPLAKDELRRRGSASIQNSVIKGDSHKKISGQRNHLNRCLATYNTPTHCVLNSKVVRVPGYRSRDPGLIPSLPDFLRTSGSGTGSTQPRDYNWGATWQKK